MLLKSVHSLQRIMSEELIPKTIGVAICCYKGHIPHLEALFDSIRTQIKQPDQVVVSCSSSYTSDIPYNVHDYPFPLLIIATDQKKNAAENRNIAASHLTTDIISFFDADDIMHPQRLLFIHDCFLRHDIKIMLHNTTADSTPFEMYPTYYCLRNVLARCPWGSTRLLFNLPGALIQNAHVSVSRDVLDQIKFPEHPYFQAKEDTVFCTAVIITFPTQTMYCHNILSRYLRSGTMNVF
jgi:glycosyltransferase involved in cell wall biosynthesis